MFESAFSVLGVNVNYRIFKAGRTAIQQKKYHDPLNNADTWHDEPHCQAKGGAKRLLQQKDSIKVENKGQSNCHQFWYNQAAEMMQGKLSLQGWRRILFDEGLHIHFFHLCYLV